MAFQKTKRSCEDDNIGIVNSSDSDDSEILPGSPQTLRLFKPPSLQYRSRHGLARRDRTGHAGKADEIREVALHDTMLKPDMCVEICIDNRISFVKIVKILRMARTGNVFLRGMKFNPCEDYLAAISHSQNHVVCDAGFARDDRRPLWEQALVDVNLACVKRVRKLLLKIPYQALSKSTSTNQDSNTLYCHWIMFRGYPTTDALQQSEAREGVWRPVLPIEADQDNEGATDIRTQKQRAKRSASTPADIPPSKKRRMGQHGAARWRKQKLTCIDLFAGAGGVTLAAKAAGFKVTHAVDIDDICCQTLLLNHPDLEVLNADVTELNFWGSGLYADWVHISSPCPWWSMAKTKQCADPQVDDRNRASLYCVGEVLRTMQPRILSIEQVTGLVQKAEHTGDFFALLGQITDAGYKLSWRFSNFAENGNVQNRTRFTLFAARGDVALPAFPESTHGDPGSGKMPWTSIRTVLTAAGIDLRECCVKFKRSIAVQKRSNPDRKLPRAIMTSGSENYHWSGRGSYSLDALKVFQEFPLSYEMAGTSKQVVKQIENAVPSGSYSAYAAEIRKTLEDLDEGLEHPRCSIFNQALKFRNEQFAQPEIIVID